MAQPRLSMATRDLDSQIRGWGWGWGEGKIESWHILIIALCLNITLITWIVKDGHSVIMQGGGGIFNDVYIG